MDLQALLESSGAILNGHFVLTSGRHSDVYFEKFRVLERPDILSVLCSQIAANFPDDFDTVSGPTTGGILVACETARQMGKKALYVESENGVKTLRRNASVEPGERVLVVDDVLTTGTSIREVIDLLRSKGAEVVGVAVLIQRGEVDFGVPFYAAHRVEAESWPADELPEWLAKIPAVKPGTRIAPQSSDSLQ